LITVGEMNPEEGVWELLIAKNADALWRLKVVTVFVWGFILVPDVVMILKDGFPLRNLTRSLLFLNMTKGLKGMSNKVKAKVLKYRTLHQGFFIGRAKLKILEGKNKGEIVTIPMVYECKKKDIIEIYEVDK
jgi:ribosomal protein S28E/S33